jgi:hypothetical protein
MMFYMRSGAHVLSWIMSKIARTLGKRGGKSTAAKRTKEQRSEAASNAAKKRWAAIRADREPDPFIFEVALLPNYGFYESANADDMRSYHSNHRAKILMDAGLLERPETDKRDRIFYQPTAEGLRWWINQRIARYEKSRMDHPEFYKNGEFDPASLLPIFESQGIGNTVELYTWFNGANIFLALRDGLLDFARYRDYKGGIGCEEYVTVRLTEKGYRFYQSLPRFIEVWE